MRYEAVPLQMCKNMLLSLTTSLNKVLSVFQGSFTQTAKKKKKRWPRQHQQQKFGQQNENKKKNKMTINLRKSR